jgi:Cu(I)/Ag(I) efflux system membrane protein CusA/SilA
LGKLGSEFMPPLDEGDLLYMPSMLPGISTTKARQVLQETDRIIASFPEVERVFGKIGRAETATDPAPLSMVETVITLKPKEQWRPGMTKEKLVKDLNQAIRIPGVTNAWTMPIKTRIDMLATGIKTPIGIKVMGPDLNQLAAVSERIEARLREVEGTSSVYAERVTGGYFLDVKIDRIAIARYGIQLDDVQDVLATAVGGMNVSQTVEGLERYPINVRYPRELRTSLEALRGVLVDSPMGHQVPLGQLADLSYVRGPPVIKSEGALPNAWIYVDVEGSDIGGYVERAKQAIAGIELPAATSLVWSGQFEYMERAAERLRLIVPLTILLIFFLLYLNFKKLTEALLVMLLLPFALTGGVWMLWLLDYELSVAVGVGFIALAGVAAETGVVMIIYLRLALEHLRQSGVAITRQAIHEAVLSGAVDRARPKMMTVCAIILGLLPIMWSEGTGASVMKRVAAPMIGGMLSSTLLTLLVMPVVYGGIAFRSMRRAEQRAQAGEQSARDAEAKPTPDTA